MILMMETEKMKGSVYNRPRFPCTWARRKGKGHVFLHLPSAIARGSARLGRCRRSCSAASPGRWAGRDGRDAEHREGQHRFGLI